MKQYVNRLLYYLIGSEEINYIRQVQFCKDDDRYNVTNSSGVYVTADYTKFPGVHIHI